VVVVVVEKYQQLAGDFEDLQSGCGCNSSYFWSLWNSFKTAKKKDSSLQWCFICQPPKSSHPWNSRCFFRNIYLLHWFICCYIVAAAAAAAAAAAVAAAATGVVVVAVVVLLLLSCMKLMKSSCTNDVKLFLPSIIGNKHWLCVWIGPQ